MGRSGGGGVWADNRGEPMILDDTKVGSKNPFRNQEPKEEPESHDMGFDEIDMDAYQWPRSAGNWRGRGRPGRPTNPFQRQGALRPLTNQERNKYMREGRCFACRKLGHMARDCPTRMSKNGPQQ